jgi:putative transposase
MLFVRKYDPLIHHRLSIRLKGYDYSKAGCYFVTICCQDKMCFFGNINNYELFLNDAGIMIEKWFCELPDKFPDIVSGPFIVMPNHFHGIIINTGKHTAYYGDDPVRADLCVRPDNDDYNNDGVRPKIDFRPDINGDSASSGEHAGSPLPHVVQWFKTMTTNEYIRGVKNSNWQKFNGKLWQRNYYEHIIREEKSFIAISNYIVNNPSNWNDDEFHQ